MPAPLINQEPVLKQYDFVKLENDLLVVDPMDSTVVAVIPRKFPKEQATQGSAPSGQTPTRRRRAMKPRPIRNTDCHLCQSAVRFRPLADIGLCAAHVCF